MPQGDIIRDSQIVAGLLRRLVEQRVLLRVTIPGVKGSFNSALLRLGDAHDFVILDELNPRRGHEQLLEVRRLNASAQVQGVELRFRGEVLEVDQDAGIAFYRLPFPDEVLYVQRRGSFRVPVGMATPVTAVFERADDSNLRGRIVDLSEGGMGVEFSQRVSLTPGEILPCQMRLPDGQQLRCKLEVRHTSTPEDQNKVRLGGRFVELQPQQRKALSRLVADLQRTMIRKQPRGD